MQPGMEIREPDYLMFWAQAEQLIHALVPTETITIRLPTPGSHPGCRQRQLKPLLALRQGLLSASLLSHVSLDRGRADHTSVAVTDRRHGDRDMQLLSVLPDSPHLGKLDCLSRADPLQQGVLTFVQGFRHEFEDRASHHLCL